MDDIQERLAASLADKYEIEGPLGEGGMALVYLARDVKHDRQVAVKVLRPDLAASIGAERFLREISITAKLQHPHILPLYDSGEAEGLLYYVMPFVEGESLADLVERERQLSIDEAIRITREVAGALGHAHAYGLIHRDIKPENVMMSGGHAIVADFGIAKAVSAAGGMEVTQTGTAIGTPAYMSPEQAAGDPNLDGRADIYALGCMLYEMLVGQVPFTGPNAQAIMARHTMDQVPPPSIMRQSIMPELEDVVFCAMAKTPADRFRTAQEMVDALNAVESGGAPKLRVTRATTRVTQVVEPEPFWKRALVPTVSAVAVVAVGFGAWQLFVADRSTAPLLAGGLDPKNVAIRYFEDASRGELQHVADGLTEGLIARMQTVPVLNVVSRNGVAPFRDPAIPPDSVARALDAGSIVGGTVAKVGDEIRVTARLYDGESGADLGMRANVTIQADSVLDGLDNVVETVTRFLRQRVGEEIEVRELASGTASATAWTLVQRAERLRKQAAEVGNDDPDQAARDLARADSLLRLAEAEDAAWPQPKIDRGWIAYRRADQVEEGPAKFSWLDSAVAHAEAALAVTPRVQNLRALALRGTARHKYWELRALTDPDEQARLLTLAREDLERAVTGAASDPGLASALVTLSDLYYDLPTADVPGAQMLAQRAYEADAYLENAPEILSTLFWTHLDRESMTQARRWCFEGYRRFPERFEFTHCRLWYMVTPASPADVDSAWALNAGIQGFTRRRFLRLEADFLVGGVIARAGLVDSARAVIDRAHAAITSDIDPDLELYSREAYVRSLAGDTDRAIDLLKEYTAANPTHDFSQMLGNWWWRSLRENPRFLRELGVG
jgi:serine/threonine-protein kinase